MLLNPCRAYCAYTINTTHMLRRGQLDPQSAARAAETIERNARAQTKIIEDLLDVSRIITGNLRLYFRPIDPASFIEQALDAVRLGVCGSKR